MSGGSVAYFSYDIRPNCTYAQYNIHIIWNVIHTFANMSAMNTSKRTSSNMSIKSSRVRNSDRKGNPKGAEREPKGAEREPKGSKRDAKVNQTYATLPPDTFY